MHPTLTKIEHKNGSHNFHLIMLIIIGGDFNFAENPKLDRHKCHEKQTDTSSHSFNDLKQTLD